VILHRIQIGLPGAVAMEAAVGFVKPCDDILRRLFRPHGLRRN